MLIAFFKGEEGAQIVEYALIIAVISLALVVALQPLTLGAGIGGLIQQLTNCLTAVSCP
jgi:pilus assembly protein Flp/PilA